MISWKPVPNFQRMSMSVGTHLQPIEVAASTFQMEQGKGHVYDLVPRHSNDPCAAEERRSNARMGEGHVYDIVSRHIDDPRAVN